MPNDMRRDDKRFSFAVIRIILFDLFNMKLSQWIVSVQTTEEKVEEPFSRINMSLMSQLVSFVCNRWVLLVRLRF
jgi:hypothetical protein